MTIPPSTSKFLVLIRPTDAPFQLDHKCSRVRLSWWGIGSWVQIPPPWKIGFIQIALSTSTKLSFMVLAACQKLLSGMLKTLVRSKHSHWDAGGPVLRYLRPPDKNYPLIRVQSLSSITNPECFTSWGCVAAIVMQLHMEKPVIPAYHWVLNAPS